MDLIVFVVGSLLAIAGAVGVITMRHPVHAALMLVAALFGVAVLFVTRDAHFLAAVQVIVYTGAVVVLILFVIMLLGVDQEDLREPEILTGQRYIAGALGLAVIGGFVLVAATSSDIDKVLPTSAGASYEALRKQEVPNGVASYLSCLQTNGVVIEAPGSAFQVDTKDPLYADAAGACAQTLDGAGQPVAVDGAVRTYVAQAAESATVIRNFEDRNVEAVGETIFSRFVVPFEVTSLLLIIAVLGAVYLARRPGPAPTKSVDGEWE